jgi:hypothetical protein
MNNSLVIAPGFGSALVDPIEQNRRHNHSYVEDFAIEDLPKMARIRDARTDELFISSS